MKESAPPQPGQIIKMKSSDARRAKRRKLDNASNAAGGLESFLQPMTVSSRQDSGSRENGHAETQQNNVPLDPFQPENATTDDPADNPRYMSDDWIPSDPSPSPPPSSPFDPTTDADLSRYGDKLSDPTACRDNGNTLADHIRTDFSPDFDDALPPSAQPPPPEDSSPTTHTTTSTHCPRCNDPIPLAEQAEHLDWHFAKDLSRELQAEEASASSSSPALGPAQGQIQGQGRARARGEAEARGQGRSVGRGRGRPPGATNRAKEKGQMKLAFGRG